MLLLVFFPNNLNQLKKYLFLFCVFETHHTKYSSMIHVKNQR